MELYISIIGAIVAIIVSVLGAILANKNTIILQTRKLKEEHYIAYIEALHNYAASDINDKDALKNYVYMRDKLLLIANEKVIIKLLEFEDKGVGKTTDLHNKFGGGGYLINLFLLTLFSQKEIVKSISSHDTNIAMI